MDRKSLLKALTPEKLEAFSKEQAKKLGGELPASLTGNERGYFQTAYLDPRYNKVSSKVSAFSTQEQQERTADAAQEGWSQAWTAIKSFSANTLAGFLDGIGSNDPRGITNMAFGNTEKQYGNSINKLAQNIREWNATENPIYNGTDSIWSSEYWANQFASLGTTVGIIGEAFGEQAILAGLTGGIGNAATGETAAMKMASLLQKMKIATTAEKVKNVGNYTFGLWQGVKEAHMNGLENYNSVYQDYINNKKSTEAEARQAAAEAATYGFRLEVVPTMLLNAIQFAAIGNKFNPLMRGAGGAETGFSGFMENAFTKMVPKTAGKGVKRTADILGNVLSEGAEEGFQTSVQGAAQYMVDSERGLTDNKTLADYIFTKDLRDSVVGGLMGGGVFKLMGSGRNYIQNRQTIKNNKELTAEFISTTAERAKANLQELREADKTGDDVAILKAYKKMGYNNIEAALLFDYMRNDGKTTTFDSQVEQLSEISRIIKEGDAKGLEMLGLVDEKDENGVNQFQFLQNNIDSMIVNAEKQKDDLMQNLTFQKENLGGENYLVAARITKLQNDIRNTEEDIQKVEKQIENYKKIQGGGLTTKQNDYLTDLAAYHALQAIPENLSPAMQKTLLDLKTRTEEFAKNMEESGDTTRLPEINHYMYGKQSQLINLKKDVETVNAMILKLKTPSGVMDFKKTQVKEKVEQYKKLKDTESLEEIKDYLKTEEVKNAYSEKELEKISTDLERKLNKVRAEEIAGVGQKVQEAFNTVGTKPEINPETKITEKPLVTEDGKIRDDAPISEGERAKLQADAKRVIDLGNANKGATPTRETFEKFTLVPDVNIFGDEEGEGDATISQDAKDFTKNSSTEKMRAACKALAESYLEEYPDHSLQDFFQSMLNDENFNKEIIEDNFYYFANGYFEAKGQSLQDEENNKEAKELYNGLFAAPKRIAATQAILMAIKEGFSTTPQTEEQKKIEEQKAEAITEEAVTNSSGDVVGVDESGRPVKYRGDKIATASIKIPFMGVFYKVSLENGEYVFDRDFEAEAQWALTATADEINRRAFLLNPKTAREGVKFKVYIPTGEKLMNSKVIHWVRQADGFIHNQIITFGEWLKLDEYVEDVDMDGNLILNTDGSKKLKKLDKSEGSQIWLDKIPILMRGEVNGQELELGNAIHEVEWWNERNVSDFLKFKDLAKMSEREKSVAMAEAKTNQNRVISEGRELTRTMRAKIWNSVKEGFQAQEEPVIEMAVRKVTAGRSLKIDETQPKRSLTEANKGLKISIVFSNSKSSTGFGLIKSYKNGTPVFYEDNELVNPEDAKSPDNNGKAFTVIPYKYTTEGKPVYLVQQVDTAFYKNEDGVDTQAQQRLRALYAVKQILYNKIASYANNTKNTPDGVLGKELAEIFSVAGISDIGSVFLKNKDIDFIKKFFLIFYPEKENAIKGRKEFYKAQVEKEGLTDKVADIVVFDSNGKPMKYQSEDAEKGDSSYIQMLKDTLYTENDYLEIKDITTDEEGATLKVADVQPRIEIGFTGAEVKAILEKREEERREATPVVKEQEIAEKQKEKITEISDSQRQVVVTYLARNILKSFGKEEFTNKDITKALKKSIEDYLGYLKGTEFEEEYNYVLDNQAEILGLGEFKDAPSTVRELVQDFLSLGDLDMEETEIDDQTEIEKNHSKTAQEYNVKTSVSNKLKMVFATVENKRRTLDDFAGLPEYVELDDVFSAIQDCLADCPNSPEVFRARIEEKIRLNKIEFGFLQDILDTFENLADDVNGLELQKEVLYKLNQTKNKMYFIHSSEDKYGSKLQVMDANSRDPFIGTKNDYTESLKASDLIILKDRNTFILNEKVAREAIEVLNKLTSEFGEPNVFETVNVLSLFGINVNQDVLRSIYDNSPETYTEFRKQGKSLFAQLSKNLKDMLDGSPNTEKYHKVKGQIEELKKNPSFTYNMDDKFQNPLLRDTNNFLSTFIGAVIKHTFNVDQSMYIAGKTINSFSQPNFSSEQMRKIKGLRGEDLKTNSQHVVKQLLNSGYSKNSLLLNLITETDGNGNLTETAKSILKNLELGYISLESLKKKGFKNSNDTDITSLSGIDYDVVVQGFFGNMSAKVKSDAMERRGINLRMAKMLFPTLSDSSQMFVMDTVVMNLQGSNFEFSGEGVLTKVDDEVIDVLYSQLVLPELTRIADLKFSPEYNRLGEGGKMFLAIPALNDITNNNGKLREFIEDTETYTNTASLIEAVRRLYGDAIKGKIRDIINSEVRERINVQVKEGAVEVSGDWVENGFVNKSETGLFTSSILDTNYLKSKNVNAEPKDKTLREIQTAAYDFVINNLLSQAQIQMLFAGDLANYANVKKDESSLEISKKTSTNLSKRLKELLSPGNRIAMSEGKKYIQLMLEDTEETSLLFKSYVDMWYENVPKEDYAQIDRYVALAKEIREQEAISNQDGYEQQKLKSLRAESKNIRETLSKKYPDISGYLKNKATDAQEYTTWREHLNILYNQGRVNSLEYKMLGDKLERQSKEGVNEGNKLTKEEKVIFQPMKPLHAGMYFDKLSNGSTLQKYVYIKTSSFPLLPEMTANTKLDNLRKNMERLENPEAEIFVRASYQSGNKVGGVSKPVNINVMFENDQLTDKDLEGSYITLDRDNFSIQQDKPFKTDKNLKAGKRDEVGRGTQIEKILLGNGINKLSEDKFIFPNLFGKELVAKLGIKVKDNKISGPSLYKIYTHLATEEQEIKRDLLLKELNISPEDYRIGSIASMEKLQSALSSRLSNRQDKEILALRYIINDGKNKIYYTKEQIERLNLTPESAEFSFPIWLTPNSRKFESILNSLVSNDLIKLKFPGNSFPVASNEGFVPNKILENLSDREKSGIVYTDSYNPELGLQPERIEDGVVKPAQVLIASKFRRKVRDAETGKIKEEIIDFNTPEYLTKEGLLDTTKVPKDVLQLMSFRIPTSAHQSGSVLEIVGFLPKEMGDLMIVPKEHTTKIGEDYDIDTRYTYSGNYIVDKEGNIKLFKEEDVDSPLKGEINQLFRESQEYKMELKNFINVKLDLPARERKLMNEIVSTKFLIDVLKKEDAEGHAEEIQELEDLKSDYEKQLDRSAVKEQVLEEIRTINTNFQSSKALAAEKYEISKRKQKNTLQNIENELINLYKAVYLSPDNGIQKLITTTVNTEMAENTADVMEKSLATVKDDNFTIFSDRHQRSIMKLGASGKLGIGVHSNWVVFNALLQQSEKPVNLLQMSSDGSIDNYTLRIGNFESRGKLGEINALKPLSEVGYKDFRPRMLSEINMENQNSATDNQKLQIMGRRNENKHTINVFALLCNLGFDKDIVDVSGKKMELLIPSLFINQPIIRRYVELMEKAESAFTERTQDLDKAITGQLLIEFGRGADFYVDDFGNSTHFLTHEAMDDASANELTGQALYDSLVTPKSANQQWAVLQKFKELKGKSESLNKVQQLMNVRDLGISYFNVLGKKDSLIEEMNSRNLMISNVESLFGDALPNNEVVYNNDNYKDEIAQYLNDGYIKVGEKEDGEVILLKPNSPNNAKLLTSLSTAYYLWGNIFPYENRYIAEQIDDVLRSSKKEGNYSQKAMDIRYTVKSAIQDYMYSNTSMSMFDDVENINSERRRLMMDEYDASGNRTHQSLASYLNTLKMVETKTSQGVLPNSKRLFNKNFFKNLEFSIAKNEPSIIKYNVNNNSSFNKNRPHADLLLMSNSQEKLPDFNGDTNYTQEKLVKDLTRYALLASTENGAIGFRNYIPMAVFKKYNFDNELITQANMSIAGGRYYNLLYNGTLKAVTSLVRNSEISTDINSGRLCIEIPESFISDNNPERGNLNRVIREVNDKFGAEVLKVEGFKIFINQPINISKNSKSNFVRQFYQHNPQLAFKVGLKKVGITDGKNAGKFKTVRLAESEFEGKTPPEFICLQKKGGEVFLYEYDKMSADNFAEYNKINRLGGTGVNEYNPYKEVSQSMFPDNNLTGVELEKIPGKKEEETFNSFIDKDVTILQAVTRFLDTPKQGEQITVVQQQARDIVALFGQKDDRGNLVLLNKTLRVQAIPLKNATGKFVRRDSESDTRLKANHIYMNKDAFNNREEYDRAFAEEVVHAAVDTHITSFIESTQFNTDRNGRIIVLPKGTGKPSTPYIDKLISLYTEAANAVVDDLINTVPEFKGRSKREVLVYMMQEMLPSIRKGGAVPYFGSKAFSNEDLKKIQTYTYRLSDLHEFVAGIFTDNDFKAALSTVQYKATGQSIVQQFADVVRRILSTITNAVQGSVTEQTIDTVMNMIGAPAVATTQSSITEDMQKTDEQAEKLLEETLENIYGETSETTNPNNSFQASPIYNSNNKAQRVLQSIWDEILKDKTISKHESGQPFVAAPKYNGKTPTRLFDKFISKVNKQFGINSTASPIKFVYGRYTKTQEEIDRMTKEELNKWNGLIASGNIEYYNIEFNDTYEKILNEAIRRQEDSQNSPVFNNIQVKSGVSGVFESNSELAKLGTQQLYSQYLDNIFPDSKVAEIDNSLYISVLNQLEQENKLEKDCTGGGKLKAEDGIATLFEKGGKWEIVTDFKNAPTHKSGGKDISIQGKKVEVEKNELRIENDFGDVVVIPSKYRVEVKDAIKSNCHSCIDGIVESLPKMKDYAGNGTVFPFFGRYKRFKNSLPDNLKNTPEDDYAMRYYWKHNNKPKSFDEAINREQPMFTMENDGYYHAPSVEPNTLRFLKPKNHPTLQYELDWYNSDNPDAVDFKSRYDLDTSGKFYRYVPKNK